MKVTNVYDLKEYIKASDSCSPIRGYVVMIDEDGKTLFAKHNMIVENGRELIRDLVYDNVFYTNVGDISTSKKERKAHFSSIKFGNDNSVTKPNDNALHGKEHISFNISSNEVNMGYLNSSGQIVNISIADNNTTTNNETSTDTTDDETNNKRNLYISNTDGEKCILISATINTNGLTTKPVISEAGLFFTEDSDETLFSRVAFAPITINSNHIYTLNYYIYF